MFVYHTDDSGKIFIFAKSYLLIKIVFIMAVKKFYFTVKERSILLDIVNGLLYKDEVCLSDDDLSLLSYIRFKLLASLDR